MRTLRRYILAIGLALTLALTGCAGEEGDAGEDTEQVIPGAGEEGGENGGEEGGENGGEEGGED